MFREYSTRSGSLHLQVACRLAIFLLAQPERTNLIGSRARHTGGVSTYAHGEHCCCSTFLLTAFRNCINIRRSYQVAWQLCTITILHNASERSRNTTEILIKRYLGSMEPHEVTLERKIYQNDKIIRILDICSISFKE